jgi:hypothetical protein
LQIALFAEDQPGDGLLPLRVGVPLARGAVAHTAELAVLDPAGRRLPHQFRVLERWSDQSLRWVLADVLAPSIQPPAATAYIVHAVAAERASPWVIPTLCVKAEDGAVGIDDGRRSWRLVGQGDALLLEGDGTRAASLLTDTGVKLQLRGEAVAIGGARVDRVQVIGQGPIRADVAVEGGFTGPVGCPLAFRAIWSFIAGHDEIYCDLRVRNPRAARHAGGLWDLGDPGSWQIRDLTLQFPFRAPIASAHWTAEPDHGVRAQSIASTGGLCIYQDSSGGAQWNSPNHVEADGTLGVSFCGYRVTDDAGATVAVGKRAQPWISASSVGGTISVAVDAFWQNFPLALRCQGSVLEVGLFPSERRAPTELQGGEQKRHRLVLRSDLDTSMPLAPRGLRRAWVDPSHVEASGAVSGLVRDLGSSPAYEALLSRIVEGPASFEARREIIDEYGWRHYGDLYADHEAVRATGPQPYVSHYNNQYDFVLGAAMQSLRTGDARWARLLDASARHTVDIDVYHTDGDKAAFNGGLFWHTDHYVPARKATHRTYSGANANGRDYGGGPSNEHNYTSGLLLHHLITGDPDSREAVVGLADWVIAMDDGRFTLLGVIDDGPTGEASKTVDSSFHGPGRGAGNSIGALLDAYRLTRRRAYLTQAEALLQRCVHPCDDIASLGLGDVERRWSYLVFLQVLGKYLELKFEMSETDYSFHYARASLLHYAEWVLANEVPYCDVLHKVEYPTETWPAHDIRKCHVLHLAAWWADSTRAAAFRDRAGFYHDRCFADVAAFTTHDLTRPMVILCVNGYVHAYAMQHDLSMAPGAELPPHAHDFGAPIKFVPQRARFRATLKSKASLAVREMRRLAIDRLTVAQVRRKVK